MHDGYLQVRATASLSCQNTKRCFQVRLINIMSHKLNIKTNFIYLLFYYLLKYIYAGLANYIAVFFLGVQLKIFKMP